MKKNQIAHTSKQEYDLNNAFISKKHRNKDDLSNDESESMDDDSRDKDFEIDNCTESGSERCSSSLNWDDIISPAYETSHKIPPAQ